MPPSPATDIGGAQEQVTRSPTRPRAGCTGKPSPAIGASDRSARPDADSPIGWRVKTPAAVRAAITATWGARTSDEPLPTISKWSDLAAELRTPLHEAGKNELVGPVDSLEVVQQYDYCGDFGQCFCTQPPPDRRERTYHLPPSTFADQVARMASFTAWQGAPSYPFGGRGTPGD